VSTTIEKKNAGRAVMPEEYRVLSDFADIVERQLQSVRDEARQARIAEINAVKATLPENAFSVPVTELELPDNMIETLQPLENVGEIMLRFLIDENRLRRMFGAQAEFALERLQEALDKVVIPDEPEVGEVETVADETAIPEEAAASVEAQVEDVAEEPVEAFPDVAFPDAQPEQDDKRPSRSRSDEREEPLSVEFDEFDDDDDLFDDDSSKSKSKRKKERQKRRQLVYDEETGQTYAKRRRKGGRKRESWEDLDY